MTGVGCTGEERGECWRSKGAELVEDMTIVEGVEEEWREGKPSLL